MITHSSILTWEIPWTEEPRGLQSMWSQNSQTGLSPGKGNGHPLQYSCLESPMERGAWWATVCVVMRVRHDLVTKPPPEPEHEYVSKVLSLFLYSQNQLNS